jgi:hypothetical protein
MPTYSRPIAATLIDSGLVGTLGYTVTSAAGSTLVARTTSGITESGSSGQYSASVANWDTSWSGFVAWDAGAGELAREAFLAYAPQGGDSFARLGAPAGASLAADVATIAAKTTNLPADPADASDVATAFGAVNTTLGTLSGYVDTEVAAIKAKTDLIPSSPAAVGSAMTVSDKTGFALSSTGLDAISVADPGGVASHTSLAKMIVALWRRSYKKVAKVATSDAAGNVIAYADDGTTANATQAYTTDDDGNQTVGAAT